MTVKIKYDRTGAVKKIKGNIGRTRANRAALELWKGNVQPTFWYKTRRFIKRMAAEFPPVPQFSATRSPSKRCRI